MTARAAREVLGMQLSVGDHICGFYRKPSERDDILIPFLVEGLKAGDKCTCVVDSCTPDDVLASMSEHLEVGPYVAGCQLEVLDSYGTYLAGGGFLPERMLQFWEAKARQSLGSERAGSRGGRRARGQPAGGRRARGQPGGRETSARVARAWMDTARAVSAPAGTATGGGAG